MWGRACRQAFGLNFAYCPPQSSAASHPLPPEPIVPYRIIRCVRSGPFEFLNPIQRRNTVRITWIITLACAAAIVSAQQPVAKGFSSAADVQSMIEKAKKERKSDQPNFIQPI